MNKPISMPGFARPAFVEAAKKRLDALLKQHPDIEFVDAILADICGTLRGKRLPVNGDAAHLFESGMQIPLSIYLMDASGEMVNPFGRGIGDGDPDGSAWPIPETISPRVGRGTEARADADDTARPDRHAASGRAARRAGTRARTLRRVEAAAGGGAGTRILSDRPRTRRRRRATSAAAIRRRASARRPIPSTASTTSTAIAAFSPRSPTRRKCRTSRSARPVRNMRRASSKPICGTRATRSSPPITPCS